ncbi:hypothetical protein [Prevotella intermedia]|uniref:Uncharacterized protein n=1 Tax=Prevotella intermedia TaxID=28131 RepID=A0A2G8I487_PREIN|nr:hypothetical protein [Prevotella intermedia]ATV32094.1 hypothetical protein CTM46_11425 [Prevotella intermedia]ATV39268.1 hypothetical protein CUB95_11775 [Prevotella intermedia]PIK18305.1 hypothetical protein CTI16_04010 [Prevotella intermedia]PJI21583.1 hypothetical protein CTM45_12405 [Prevotella intermedia]
MRICFEGIRDTETRAYLFAEVSSGAVIPDGKNDIIKRDRSGIFDKIIDAYRPFLPQSGAVLNSNFIIITPMNDYFYGFSFNKDLTGWRQQIEKGAKLLNVRIGRIVNEDFFLISDGTEFSLSDCEFERYNFKIKDEEGGWKTHKERERIKKEDMLIE